MCDIFYFPFLLFCRKQYLLLNKNAIDYNLETKYNVAGEHKLVYPSVSSCLSEGVGLWSI